MVNLLALVGATRDLLTLMLKRSFIVAACVVICVFGAWVSARRVGPVYTTQMIVTAPAGTSSGLSGALRSMGGGALGALAGGGTGGQFDSYVALLKSSTVAASLLNDKQIMAELYGASVDPKTGKWRTGPLKRVMGGVDALFGVTRADHPTVENVQGTLSGMITISQEVLKISQVEITCRAPKPQICHDVLLAANKAAQEQLDILSREEAKRFASSSQYVLQSISNVTLREALGSMVANAQVQATLANIGSRQAVVLIPPTIPSTPTFPTPMFLIKIGILAGLILGAVVVQLTRNWSREDVLSLLPQQVRALIVGSPT
jgi:hypothetical protein